MTFLCYLVKKKKANKYYIHDSGDSGVEKLRCDDLSAGPRTLTGDFSAAITNFATLVILG